MADGILTDKLTKVYPGQKSPSLDSVSLQVNRGEVYGFLGANGAGKSTTIRLLMNFIQPTGGHATIMGLDSVTNSVRAKRHIGYLAGDVALYPKMTGKELLDYLASLQHGVDTAYRRTLEKRFEAQTDKPIGELSKGNRQKIGILQALMHKPAVLILDEPTSGLDPLMQEAFYDSIREASQRGTAVLMSSHNLAEAQRVCDRIGIIKHGKLVREQATGPDTHLSKPIFRVVLGSSKDTAHIKSIGHLTFLGQEGETIALVQAKDTLQNALRSLSQLDVRDLTTQQLSLEDEFMEFYEDTPKDAA